MDKITASLMEKKYHTNQDGLAEGRTSLVFSVRGPIPIQVILFQMSVSFFNLDLLMIYYTQICTNSTKKLFH